MIRMKKIDLSDIGLKEANNKFWYLRECDFLPELLRQAFNRQGITNHAELEEMNELGNLFTTREEALSVARKMRACLRSLTGRTAVGSTSKGSHTPLSPAEINLRLPLPRSQGNVLALHIQGNAHGRTDVCCEGICEEMI